MYIACSLVEVAFFSVSQDERLSITRVSQVYINTITAVSTVSIGKCKL
jgi:hypothetical protein